MSIAYLYDGSWEGVLSAVFAAYANKEQPKRIVPEEDVQLEFNQQTRKIQTDAILAQRVEQGVLRQLGSQALETIGVAFLSEDLDKGTIIYNYIRTGLAMGRRIYNALTQDAVLAIDRINLSTKRESHQFQQFTRFSLMDNQVYFGRITPKNNVLPLIMPYFVDRFTDQPFLLLDGVHHLAGVYDTKEWQIVEAQDFILPNLSTEELEYRRLWKQFYHSVAIEERTNPTCRRNHMPKRFWANMTEFMAEKAR